MPDILFLNSAEARKGQKRENGYRACVRARDNRVTREVGATIQSVIWRASSIGKFDTASETLRQSVSGPRPRTWSV
jgi:hypothetical protein